MGARQIVIVGGGYGGLAALRRLRRGLNPSRASVLLLDAGEHHVIKTRFHEIAVSRGRDLFLRFSLPALARASRARFTRARVVALDLPRRCVVVEGGEVPYDWLVLAPGGQTNTFGVPGAADHAVSLQTYPAAAEGGRRVRFLGIDRDGGPHRRAVVCGAGIEGLEVAALLRQVAPEARCEITVVERDGALLARSQCGEAQRLYSTRYLERHAIGLRLATTIQAIEPGGAVLAGGESLEADLVYWCTGVRRVDLDGVDPASPFMVDEHLQVRGHPEVFALGDFATVDTAGPWANLGSAQRALYQGELAAENLLRAEAGRPLKAADYRPHGEVIALGDLDGVGIVEGVGVQGLPAAVLKKGIEAHYLADLLRDVPAHLTRTVFG